MRLELVPVVVAAASWGSSWQGKFIQFNSENLAVVEVLNKQYSSKVMLNHLLRCLFFLQQSILSGSALSMSRV